MISVLVFLIALNLARKHHQWPSDQGGTHNAADFDEPPSLPFAIDASHQQRWPRAPAEIADACARLHVVTDEQSIVPIKTNDISRYIVGHEVGHGTYSKVRLGLDSRTQQTVVLKFLTSSNITVKYPREVLMLRQMADVDHVVELLDVVEGGSGVPVLVFPYVRFAAARDLTRVLTFAEIVEYARRIAVVLDRAHARCILHADLKTLNVLIDRESDIFAVSDWGLSQHYLPDVNRTYHIGTRTWKAPELLLGFHHYTYAIDIWSLGIIVLDWLAGATHTMPASSLHEQLLLIVRLCGRDEFDAFVTKYNVTLHPNFKMRLAKITAASSTSDDDDDDDDSNRWQTSPRITMRSPKSPVNLQYVRFVGVCGEFVRNSELLGKTKHCLHNDCSYIIDLLSKMLHIDPEMRITAAAVLQHEAFARAPPFVRPVNVDTADRYNFAKINEAASATKSSGGRLIVENVPPKGYRKPKPRKHRHH